VSGYSKGLKARAGWLASIWRAVAEGETLQKMDHGWHDWEPKENPGLGQYTGGPHAACYPEMWRVKPKPPRKRWTKVNKAGGEENCTEDPIRADQWRDAGFTVIEWQEVRHE
jgi:hypothetical protein